MPEAVPGPAKEYLQLRQYLFDLTPAEVNITPTGDARQVWGVVMETAYEVGSATLVCLADGTTSLYYSTGGGMLGSGDYTPLAEAARALVARAQGHLHALTPTQDRSIPPVGQVSFFFLTFGGIYSATTSQEALSGGEHPLSPLYHQAQETLDQLRQLAEKKRR